MNRLQDYEMPVREVLDREPSVFRHDIESLKDNSFAIITTNTFGEIGLVSKARNYSSTPYDVMITSFDESLSSLEDLSDDQQAEFFKILNDASLALMTISGLRIATGLNQHPGSHLLPERDTNNSKTRVQTLRPLHAHIYEIDIHSGKKIKFGDLPVEDQRDIRDPFIKISGDIAVQALWEKLGMKASSSPVVPPWGIHVPAPPEQIPTIQECLQAEYSKWHDIVVSGSIESVNNTTPYVKKALQHIATMLKGKDEVKPYLTFTNGFAVTYSITGSSNTGNIIVVHPRLMSRGNSPDAMGIYVADSFEETEKDRENKREAYLRLISSLVDKYRIEPGAFIDNKEQS